MCERKQPIEFVDSAVEGRDGCQESGGQFLDETACLDRLRKFTVEVLKAMRKSGSLPRQTDPTVNRRGRNETATSRILAGKQSFGSRPRASKWANVFVQES